MRVLAVRVVAVAVVNGGVLVVVAVVAGRRRVLDLGVAQRVEQGCNLEDARAVEAWALAGARTAANDSDEEAAQKILERGSQAVAPRGAGRGGR